MTVLKVDLQPVADSRISKRHFLNRFTDTEAIQIDLASIGATVEAAAVRRQLTKFEMSSYIDLTDPDTINGVNALEAAGLLAEGRASEILTNPIQTHERFRG